MYAYPKVNMFNSFPGRKKTFVIPCGNAELEKVIDIVTFVGSNPLPGQNRRLDIAIEVAAITYVALSP